MRTRMLVKASIAGAIVTNALFMLGASFLLGGLKHHVQEYNRISARLQSGLLFLATIALLEDDVQDGSVFPAASHMREVARAVSVATATVVYDEGYATRPRPHDLRAAATRSMYTPDYA